MVQQLNTQNINNLRPIFQPRDEPNFAWKSAVSATLALPGLRGFWPMSAVGVAGQAIDLQGLGNHLVRNGGDFGYDGIVPLIDYNGVNEYHNITDAASANAFDVLGTEAYIEPVKQGLTIGGWFKFDDDPPAAFEHLIGKWAAAANRSYSLIRLVGTQIRFRIFDGAATTFATTTATTTSDTWYHCVGRFDTTLGDVFVYLNSVEVVTVVAVASINNGAADFTIAASSTPGDYLDGQASLCWICAASLSEAIIKNHFHQTKAMYNVR